MKDNSEKQQLLYERYLNFHEELLKVHLKNMQRMVAVVSFKKLSEIDVDKSINQGAAIITPENVIIEEKDLENIFDEVFPLLKKYYGQNPEINRFEDLYDKRKISLLHLIQHIVCRDDDEWNRLSQNLKISKKTLKKIAEYVSTPYLELCSEYLNNKINYDQWENSFCPICGSYPRMAAVNEYLGFRVLWCHLCDTQWRFKQHVCPFCLNDDLTKLKHIFPADKSPNRIDACDNCSRYLKIIDEQLITKQTNFVVDNVATYKLDLLALRSGYSKLNSK